MTHRDRNEPESEDHRSQREGRASSFARPIITVGAALLALGSLGGCAALSDTQLVAFGAEYWDAQPGGALSVDEAASIGDELDLDSTLDFDSEKVWVYRAAATVGPTRLEATFIDLGYNGLSTIASSFDFSGETFTSGNVLSSDVDTSVLQVHAETGLYNWNIIQFGFVAGLDQLRIDTTLTDVDALVSASEEYDEWIPVIGITGGASIPLMAVKVFADAKISGIIEEISLDTLDGDYLSSEIRGGVSIDDGFKIGIGYRSLEADFDDGGANYDFDLGGGFLFIDLEF